MKLVKALLLIFGLFVLFVVNGSRWVTDPRATRYSDDGFGNRNAVLAVTAPST